MGIFSESKEFYDKVEAWYKKLERGEKMAKRKKAVKRKTVKTSTNKATKRKKKKKLGKTKARRR